jgi:hypothetical protein
MEKRGSFWSAVHSQQFTAQNRKAQLLVAFVTFYQADIQKQAGL